ncbi:TPA: hypothetical protein ACM4E9_004239 [Escherichia coli]
MIKFIFKYSATALLVLSVNVKITLATSIPDAGFMIAQTTEPSVGHRTATPTIEHKYENKTAEEYFHKTPLPGVQINIANQTINSDKDNNSYGAGEKIETFRSIYRIDRSGNEVAIEKDNLIVPKSANSYNITEDDVGSKIKFVYIRKSTSDSFTPLPKESYSREYITEVVSSPLVPTEAVLYVNGVERPDYTMYPDEVGYIRYRVVNRDGQPLWNISIKDSGSSDSATGAAGSIKLESSKINMNGEVERKIVTHSGTGGSSGASLSISAWSSYLGYNLLTKNINITLKSRP